MRKSNNKVQVLGILLAILTILVACTFPGLTGVPTATPAPIPSDTPAPQITPSITSTTSPVPSLPPTVTPTITYKETPSTLSSFRLSIYDRVSNITAKLKTANGGDDFTNNIFERPFNQDMTYLPYLDIAQADLSRGKGSQWLYFEIHLVESPSTAPDPKPLYGIEIDTNLDGRGDFLVESPAPQTNQWSGEGVKVFQDANQDVGGSTPIASDLQGKNGDGFETTLLDSGIGKDPDLAWVRINPADPKIVDLALKISLVGGENQGFLWAPFSDGNPQNPAYFDLDDHFTLDEAGSPLKELTNYYPLKQFYAFDNTCRLASGFNPSGIEPGVCPVPGKPQAPTAAPTVARVIPIPTLPKIVIPPIPLP